MYICGNGGSAANAIHMANDLHYGIGACGTGARVPGLKVEALPANSGVITCLANDTGYDNIYAHQLKVKGSKGDLLIVLSGSGNSVNVVRALETAKCIGINSFAIVAFSGGRCKEMAETAIHFPINDMQVAEDAQLIADHLCMQWLGRTNPLVKRLNATEMYFVVCFTKGLKAIVGAGAGKRNRLPKPKPEYAKLFEYDYWYSDRRITTQTICLWRVAGRR